MSETKIDFGKWAAVGPKDDTGFGRQLADLKAVLGLGYYLAAPSDHLANHPLISSNERFLDPKFSDDELKSVLAGVQGIVFPERPWHPRLLQVCRELGVISVCVPNWEWFRGTDEHWQSCDLFVCQSQFTLKIVNQYDFRNAVYVPVALDIERFPSRNIAGQARLFVHNAGLVDAQDRKGTRDTILAFKRTKHSDIRLLVRVQKEVELPDLDDRITVQFGNLVDPSELYASGDVAVQPSKMEGNGFMVLEPFASGMPVITTDYPPMNEYVTTKELLVRKRWFKRRAFPTTWVKHAHLRLPDINDLARKIDWCASNDMGSICRFNRQSAESLFSKTELRSKWYQALASLPKAGDK